MGPYNESTDGGRKFGRTTWMLELAQVGVPPHGSDGKWVKAIRQHNPNLTGSQSVTSPFQRVRVAQ